MLAILKKSAFLFLIFCMSLQVLATEQSLEKDETVEVYVGIGPEKFLVEQIGGELVNVKTLLPPGGSPHSYEPNARELISLGRCGVFLHFNLPFEKSLAAKLKTSFKDIKIVNLTSNISFIQSEYQCTHEGHHHDHSHEREQLDPHIWMSPEMMKQLGESVCEFLNEYAPQHKKNFDANFIRLSALLDELQIETEKKLKNYKDNSFLVYHPSYGYFAKAFQLRQVAIEFEGKQPTTKYLKNVIEYANEKKIKLLIVQPQFDRRMADNIASRISGKVISIDPLSEDYFALIRDLSNHLVDAFKTDKQHSK